MANLKGLLESEDLALVTPVSRVLEKLPGEKKR